VQEDAVKFDRVLVPLDGSWLAEKALPSAMALLSERPGATLMLMRAAQATMRVPWVDPIEAQIEVVDEAEGYLQHVADRIRDDEPDRTVTTSVSYGPPVRAIVDAAETGGAQLIVMSTHSRSGLRRMVLGSIAESVLRATTTPVLLVPADAGQLPPWSASVFADDEEAVGV
jgi:nucleotide-binding universal stress UspA family protein